MYILRKKNKKIITLYKDRFISKYDLNLHINYFCYKLVNISIIVLIIFWTNQINFILIIANINFKLKFSPLLYKNLK